MDTTSPIVRSNSPVPLPADAAPAVPDALPDVEKIAAALTRQHEEAERGDHDLAVPSDAPDEEQALRFRQHLALQRLSDGGDIPAAAKFAGVSRMTVYRWIKSDERFRAALQRRRDEKRAIVRQQLLTISNNALDNIRSAVSRGHIGASLAVLRGVGLLSPRHVETIIDEPPPPPQPRTQRQLPAPQGSPRELLISFTPAQPKLLESQPPMIDAVIAQPPAELAAPPAADAEPEANT